MDNEETDSASQEECEQNFPKMLTSLHCENYARLTDTELKVTYVKQWAKYICTDSQCRTLEAQTRDQYHRKCRGPASKAHDVFVRKHDTAKWLNVTMVIVPLTGFIIHV